MATTDKPKFTIVGAGLSGALMAGYLGRAGYGVQMFEKLPDLVQLDDGCDEIGCLQLNYFILCSIGTPFVNNDGGFNVECTAIMPIGRRLWLA